MTKDNETKPIEPQYEVHFSPTDKSMVRFDKDGKMHFYQLTKKDGKDVMQEIEVLGKDTDVPTGP